MCSPEFNSACTHARSAHTRLVVLSYGLYNSQPCTKVLVRIFTGRRHQIRVHCSNLGHTIVGDYTYSQRKDVGPPRQMLHAYRYVLPKTNKIDLVNMGLGFDLSWEGDTKIGKEIPNYYFLTYHLSNTIFVLFEDPVFDSSLISTIDKGRIRCSLLINIPINHLVD